MRRSLSSRRNKVPSVALPHFRHSLRGLVRPIEIIARHPTAIIWERDLPWVRTSGALTPVNQIRPLRIAASQLVDSEPRTIEKTSSSCCSRHGHRPAPSPTQSIQCTPYPAQGIGSKLSIVEMTNSSRCSRGIDLDLRRAKTVKPLRTTVGQWSSLEYQVPVAEECPQTPIN